MKKRSKCATNGVLHGGICGASMVGDNSICGAHGNRKCIHKRDADWTKDKEKATLKVFESK